MRLGMISDLHVDVNLLEGTQSLLDLLSEEVKKQEVKYLLIAGDISNNYVRTLNFIEEIEEKAGVKCLFVPGNHDIWNAEWPNMNAWEIYKELQQFPRNLAKEPFILNDDWVVIGDLGWYDFSFGGQGFDHVKFEQMEIDGRIWKDKLYAAWEMPTVEVHQTFYAKLQMQLEAYSDKQIILMLHVVPHRDFTVPATFHHTWDYLNAFLGSKEYGELILSYPVRYAVFGHVHFRKQLRIDETLFICSCLGYMREWSKPDCPEQEIAESLAIIDIK